MVYKSRLLKSAFIIPLYMSLAVATAWGFELKPDTDDTDYPTYSNSVTDADPDGDSILIDGTPTNDSSALLINSDNVDVTIDGVITIRSHQENGDESTTALTAATGVKITGADNGRSIRFKSGARIYIIEGLSLADRRGPDYDADSDGFADNDVDQDGISEGSHALDGNNLRVGFWKVGAMSTDIIGEAGSSIVVYGNGVGAQHAAGVVISDANHNGNLDLSTFISMFGDKTRGVDILSQITGYYRQRDPIDVRGEDGIGIHVDGVIGGSLMIESLVNATGYSTAPTPGRGIDESGLSPEQQTVNQNERRRGGAAVNIVADVNGGVIIGGRINRLSTQAEATALNSIIAGRADDDDNAATGNAVIDQKTLPFHYDENRIITPGRVTSYGETENLATMHINAEIGSDGAVETLLDTTNDDGLADTDAYRSGLKQFFFSHGLVNRGSIEANGWYDGFKGDALLLGNNATISGGIFNSGTISATAYNENAQALIIGPGATLTDGLRSDKSILLNEGSIMALVSTDTGSSDFDEGEEYKATAITLAAGANLPSAAVFINRSSVSAVAEHNKAETSDADGNIVARAFDFSTFSGNVGITQELLKADALLDPSTANSAANPYLGGGDTDIDLNGDGVIDTRDVFSATDRIPIPEIIGDVKFGDGDNVFAVKSGVVNGNISFGEGADALTLSNEIADDVNDNYIAPITNVTGRITKGAGNLDIILGKVGGENFAHSERTRLHFIGQEGAKKASDPSYVAAEDPEGLTVANLNLNKAADLRFTINPENLTGSVLDVTNLVFEDDAMITPSLASLFSIGETETVNLISYNSLTKNNSIDTYLNNEETPFIYDVALVDENATISAIFSIKSASALGLNQTEGDGLSTVLAHFAGDSILAAAITAIDNGDDFKTAYRQLLPHYSDGTAQQLSGLADMATGAVSQHLQLINAGGRRGGDGWVQQYGDYRKQNAGINGATVSGTSYAISLGYDLPVSVIDALGLYLQMGFSAVNEKSAATNQVKSESIAYGAYLSDQIGPLQYQLNAAYGFVDLESERLISFAGLVDQLDASWDATSTAASARLAYPILQNEHVLRLEAGMNFFRFEHDDYSESEIVGRNFAMRVKGGESEQTSQFIGLRGGYRRGGGDPVAVVWEPNYYFGWRTTTEISPYQATANFIGSNESFTLQSHIEPEDALDVGLGFAAHNDYFAFEFNYRARIADDEKTHGGGVSIRLLF